MNGENDVILVENILCVLHRRTGISIYDFDFRAYFPSRTLPEGRIEVPVIARMGAFDDYENTFAKLLKNEIRLLHTPEEHFRSSQLSGWYNLIEELTPRSRWYAEIPLRRIYSKSSGGLFL
jgi:hypothetical protein